METRRLIKVEGKLNGAKYQDIPNEIPAAQCSGPQTGSKVRPPKILREDIREGLRDNSINVLKWNNQRSDLNPIKHLWRNLKMP